MSEIKQEPKNRVSPRIAATVHKDRKDWLVKMAKDQKMSESALLDFCIAHTMNDWKAVKKNVKEARGHKTTD